MKWSSDKSVRLSRWCVIVISVLLACLCVLLPFLIRWSENMYFGSGFTLREVEIWVYLIFYALALVGANVLYHLYRLLHHISKDEVFITSNVRHLRVIAWACLIAGIVCIAGGWFAPSLYVMGIAIAFISLILRVVKNVFAEAVSLKTENDYTI